MPAFIEVPPIGIGNANGQNYDDGFTYRGDRPARHCGLCGASYQPELARHSEYATNEGVRQRVEYLLMQWGRNHTARHSEKEWKEYYNRGNLMTPEAAIKLIPLGIYPLTDLLNDDEVAQAGLEAPRAPNDDVPTH